MSSAASAVLKTASFGYDGKGQQKLTNNEQLKNAFENLGGQEGIFEAWVPFTKEVSVVAARTFCILFAFVVPNLLLIRYAF